MKRSGQAFLIAVFAILSASLACDKDSEPERPAASYEHVGPSPVGTTQPVVQKKFSLKSSVTFPFEVPVHAATPHLQGTYESFLGTAHGASDDTANIDFLILNEDQQADFAANRPGEAMLTVEASHDQNVNFNLPPTLNTPVKYYLVFRNPDGGKTTKAVSAEFHIDF